MDCLDENLALKFVEGLLPPETEAAVDHHIAVCAECRWLVTTAGAAALAEASSGALTIQADWDWDAQASAATDDPHGRRISERLHDTYVITRFIGSGGMGSVYEASHCRLPRRFAVKFLSGPVASDCEAIARLRQEAEVTSRLSHPNIVDVVDFNYADDGTPFMVMELLEGESLAQRLRREKTIRDLGELAHIVRQVTSALDAAHRCGVIHRDLKPSNIFLCPAEEAGRPRVKVLDFGLSKVAGPAAERSRRWAPVTRVGAVLGSPAFMSPEQAAGQSAAVDVRADIYSLGATLFKMLTGRGPFVGGTVEEILRQVKRGELEDAERWRSIPGRLRKVVWRALRKAPRERQGSMAELWQELEEAFQELEISPEPGPSLSRRHSGPRRRWLVAVVLTCLCMGAAVLVTSWRQTQTTKRRVPLSAQPGPPRAATPLKPADARTAPTLWRDAGHFAHLAPPDGGRGRRRASTIRTPPRRSAAVGSLVVQSKEGGDQHPLWADVYLDGKLVGQTALTLDVPAGLHTVEVRRAGYLPVSRRVRVGPGSRTRISIVLERSASRSQ